LRDSKDELNFLKDQLLQKDELFKAQKVNFDHKFEQEREKYQLEKQKDVEQQGTDLRQKEIELIQREEKLKEDLRDYENKINSQQLLKTSYSEVRLENLSQSVDITKSNDNMDEIEFRIRELRDEVNRFETENITLQLLLRKKEEEVELEQGRQVELENAIDEFREEIDSKDQQITQYSIQIMNKESQIINRWFSFFSKAPSLDLQHELENKTIDVQEKNTEISKLNQTLKRVIEEKRAEMNSKKRTLMHYERLISDTRKKYIELKDEMLWSAIKKNDKSTDEILSQISKEFLEEHETLKRKYFFYSRLGHQTYPLREQNH